MFGKDTRTRAEEVSIERRALSRWSRLLSWIVMAAILGLLMMGFLGAARLLGR